MFHSAADAVKHRVSCFTIWAVKQRHDQTLTTILVFVVAYASMRPLGVRFAVRRARYEQRADRTCANPIRSSAEKKMGTY